MRRSAGEGFAAASAAKDAWSVPPILSRGLLDRAFRQHNLAARLLHRRDRRLRGAGDLDRDRRLELTFGQQANAVADATQQPGGDQRLAVDRFPGREPVGVQRLLEPAEIHDLVVLLENLVAEAALWQPAVQRGLAALETVDRHAGSRRLTLAAAPRCLALARPDAAPNPLRAIMRARIVPDLIEFHRSSSDRRRLACMRAGRPRSYSTTRMRCCTFRIMPRTAGVSSSVRWRRILLRPRPFSVAS